ncbi:hypothetical protein ACFWY9_19660 [Amycolatopsis sp. NPDC059027]|uniref:hypothetical protein n=1 Tax=Amycolatopsis sp. NPDC059027 TaxID=3346709 RepID=UPI0036707D61
MGDQHNEFGGEARIVVQAHNIYGGMRFGEPDEPRSVPQQNGLPPKYYTNNEVQLLELDRGLAGRDGDRPCVAIIRGTPGSGRSELTREWIHRHRDEFPDGHFLAPLGRTTVKDALVGMLLEASFALERLPPTVEALSAMWRGWSTGKRVALVIDDALSAAQVEPLLPGPGPSVVLVVEAGGLGALRARHGAALVTLEPLGPETSRVLLEQMVEDKERLAAEPEAVEALIAACDGSVAALNVVGAMFIEHERWKPSRLHQTLQRRGGVVKVLPRDAVFDFAFDRLEPLAQRCYLALGAHPGGDMALASLSAVLGEEADDEVEQLLTMRLAQETQEERYLVSGLVKDHARSKAADDELLREIVSWYARRGWEAQALVQTRDWVGKIWSDRPAASHQWSSEEAVAWLLAERVNLVEAAKAAHRLGAHEDVVRLCLALWPIHLRRGYAFEMADVNRLGFESAVAWSNDLAASVLAVQRAFAAMELRDWDDALSLLDTAAEYAGRADSREAKATVVETRGLVRLACGDSAGARGEFRENLALAREIGDARRIALARFHLAKTEEPAVAMSLLDEAAAALDEEPLNQAKITLWRGKKLLAAGDLVRAAEILDEVAVAAAKSAWHRERAETSEAKADLALECGDLAVARSHLEDALNVYALRGFTEEAVDIKVRLNELS